MDSPTLPHHWEKKQTIFFVLFKACYTQVSGPVQTTCSNTISSIHTRHFHTVVLRRREDTHREFNPATDINYSSSPPFCRESTDPITNFRAKVRTSPGKPETPLIPEHISTPPPPPPPSGESEMVI